MLVTRLGTQQRIVRRKNIVVAARVFSLAKTVSATLVRQVAGSPAAISCVRGRINRFILLKEFTSITKRCETKLLHFLQELRALIDNALDARVGKTVDSCFRFQRDRDHVC